MTLIALFLLVVLVLLALLPVKIAAGAMGARRTSFGACLVAVILAFIVNAVFGRLFAYGWFVSVLVTGFAYMLVLDTTYLRGVMIAVLQAVVSFLLVLLLGVLGFATALVPFLGTHAATGAVSV